MKRINIILLIALIFTTNTSWGTLITKDFLNVGDNLITLDTTTGLEWLDFSVSAGQSINSLNAGFGELLTTHNFRIDDSGALSNLIASVGYSLTGIDTLLDTLGCTVNCGMSNAGANVYSDDGFAIISWYKGSGFFGDYETGPDSSYFGNAHALIRSIDVSEPYIMLIFLVLTGGLLRIRRSES